MKALRFPKAKNNHTLRKLVTSDLMFAEHANNIKAQYITYVKQKGNPATINPIGLNKAMKDFLKARYDSPTKKHGLDWIKPLRNKHGHAYCPMCGSANVKTLEHYLPKADYPEFYVLTFNLIPSCHTCNQKRCNIANAPGTALPLLHPYFDRNVLNLGFLFTKITGPFDVPMFDPAIDTDTLGQMTTRAQRHIDQSIDRDLFFTWSMNQWSEWNLKAYREPDLKSLLAHISTDLLDHVSVAGPNTWTAAFLRGLLMNHDAVDWLRLNPSAR